MKILICPDKFKGSFSAEDITDLISSALKTRFPEAEFIGLPLADGGEGSAKILAPLFDAYPILLKVHNPIFKQIKANYFFSRKHKTAIIEMSAASGLHLLNETEKNPLHTSTYGTGEMISDAVKKRAEIVYLTLGGSATNDAGCGAAEALGYKFYDKKGIQIRNITGKNLIEIAKIDDSEVTINFQKIKLISLYDVRNPLYGKNGAAYIYAKQKGAEPDEIKLLDNGLKHFAEIVQKQYGTDIGNCDGCGAAGGFGAGSKVFFNAESKAGAETFLRLSRFNELIKDIDLIITGEGKFDTQSFKGKLTGTIIQKATENNIPVIIICGISELKTDASAYHIFPLFEKFPGTEYAKKQTPERIKNITENLNIKHLIKNY